MLFSDVAEYYGKLENISSRLEMIDVLTQLLKQADKTEMRNLIYITQGILAPSFDNIEIGMADKMVEEAIAKATGFNKEEINKTFRKTGDLGLTAEEFAGKTKLRRMSSKKFEVNEVFHTLYKISKTNGSGSKEIKIRMLAEVLAASTKLEARYITRFVLKQLRLGLGDATILEALSKMVTGERKYKTKLEAAYNICSDLGKVGEVLATDGEKGIANIKVELFSPIRVALAERLPTAEQILKKMHGTCAVESKYDGLRVQVHMDKKNKKVEIFSRNLERLTHMFPELVNAALHEIDAEEAIFEGEAIAYDEVSEEFLPFQETIQRKRKHDVLEMSKEIPLHIFSFDLFFVDGIDYTPKPYKERHAKLESLLKTKDGTIRMADKIIATSAKQIETYFDNAIENGLEGIMAKDLQSPYIAGARKFSWIKMKRSYKGELSDTVDLVIIGYYLGKGTRAEFQFGGLLCASYNTKTDMFETVTRIGTGFTEEHMKMFKQLLDKVKLKNKPARVEAIVKPDFWVEPLYIVTVRADEITKSQMHTCGKGNSEYGYALRFPRLVSNGVRDDKKAEDATSTDEIIKMYKLQKKKGIS